MCYYYNMVKEIRIPTIEELVQWHNDFGVLLERRETIYGVKICGVDGKDLEPEEILTLTTLNVLYDRKGDGYYHVIRGDGSESDFKLSLPDEKDAYLTYAEIDLVLGTNYFLMDKGYSSPSPQIRNIIFKVNSKKPKNFNAFQLYGCVRSICNGVNVSVVYSSSNFSQPSSSTSSTGISSVANPNSFSISSNSSFICSKVI